MNIMNISVNNHQCYKTRGRTFLYKNILWCGHSGSGIEFSCECSQLDICLRGDNATEGFVTEGPARVGIYVNGIRVVDHMLTSPQVQLPIWRSQEPQLIQVKVMKLSECAMSTMGIQSILTDGIGVKPLPERGRSIEFIGDSITCGYGVDEPDPLKGFTTDTEDVTKSYAFRTGELLEAETSMVSFSGYGIISGYTDTDEPNTHSLVPDFYEKIGFSYGSPLGELRLNVIPWDFQKHSKDVVVVNLGTNDAFYCKGIPERVEGFETRYLDFIHRVRTHNPTAMILLTLGLMGHALFPSVEKVASAYQISTKDQKIAVVRLEEQIPEDGYGADSHPSPISHEKAAIKLADSIRTIMNW